VRTWTAWRPGFYQPGGEAQVRAFDADEAAPRLLAKLGYDVTPCCQLDGPPCPRCQAEADEKAHDATVDRGRDERDRER